MCGLVSICLSFVCAAQNCSHEKPEFYHFYIRPKMPDGMETQIWHTICRVTSVSNDLLLLPFLTERKLRRWGQGLGVMAGLKGPTQGSCSLLKFGGNHLHYSRPWSLWGCTFGGFCVPYIYSMPGESYCRWFRSLCPLSVECCLFSWKTVKN